MTGTPVELRYEAGKIGPLKIEPIFRLLDIAQVESHSPALVNGWGGWFYLGGTSELLVVRKPVNIVRGHPYPKQTGAVTPVDIRYSRKSSARRSKM